MASENEYCLSDETMIELSGHNNVKKIGCKKEETLLPKYNAQPVKYGIGSMMLWSCFLSGGIGN